MNNSRTKPVMPAIFVKAEVVPELQGGYSELSQGIAELTRDRVWRSGTPDKDGWYNASIHDSITAFRYWDGAVWGKDLAPSCWHNPQEWERAKDSKEPLSNCLRIRWRNVKPYRDGIQWDFLRT